MPGITEAVLGITETDAVPWMFCSLTGTALALLFYPFILISPQFFDYRCFAEVHVWCISCSFFLWIHVFLTHRNVCPMRQTLPLLFPYLFFSGLEFFWGDVCVCVWGMSRQPTLSPRVKACGGPDRVGKEMHWDHRPLPPGTLRVFPLNEPPRR